MVGRANGDIGGKQTGDGTGKATGTGDGAEGRGSSNTSSGQRISDAIQVTHKQKWYK